MKLVQSKDNPNLIWTFDHTLIGQKEIVINWKLQTKLFCFEKQMVDRGAPCHVYRAGDMTLHVYFTHTNAAGDWLK